MKKPLIEIKDFKGGMTLNEKLGREDQFHIGDRLDFSSQKGKLAPGYGWKNLTLGGVSDINVEITQMLYATDGKYYFGGDNQKIYVSTNGNTLSEAHTDTNLGGIKGMAEYEGYLYWAANTTIGRYDLSATWTDSWQTGLNTADWHPMKVSADNKLYIGHGNLIASYDGTTFTSNVLDLPSDWEVKCLEDFGYRYLAIGASLYTTSSTSVKAKIFLWDRTSSSWNDEIIIPENDIRAMIFSAGYLWIWAGESSNIYVVSEASRKAIKMFSFTKEDPWYVLKVWPAAVAHRRGTIYFGLSDNAGTTYSWAHPNVPTGVYSFPADPNNFTLNIPLRNNDYGERYRALGVLNTHLFVGYVSGTTENLKRQTSFDGETHYGDTATYESFVYEAPPDKMMLTEAFGVEFDSLPPTCQLDLDYEADDSGTWTSVFSSFTTQNATSKIVAKRIKAHSLKLRLKLKGGGAVGYSGSARPFVKRIFVTGHLIDRTY